MNWLKLTVLFVILVSCKQGTAQYNGECGDLEEVVVDEGYTTKYNLNPIFFKLKYPAGLDQKALVPGGDNKSYVFFQQPDETGVNKLMLSIGHYSVDGADLKERELEFLDWIKGIYESAGYKFSEALIQETRFDGKDYNTLRCTGDINVGSPLYDGTYKIQVVCLPSDKQKGSGLFVIMLAKPGKTEIETYDDFATKSCLAPIWQSIRFTE